MSPGYLAVVTGVCLRTVAVVSRAVSLDDTDPGVATQLPPALRPVTVTNVGPLPPLTHPERVGGLVYVKRPGECIVYCITFIISNPLTRANNEK